MSEIVLYRKFVKEINPVIRNNLYIQYKAWRKPISCIIRKSKKQHYINFFKDNIGNHKKGVGKSKRVNKPKK